MIWVRWTVRGPDVLQRDGTYKCETTAHTGRVFGGAINAHGNGELMVASGKDVVFVPARDVTIVKEPSSNSKKKNKRKK